MRYSIEPRYLIYFKGYGLFFFVKWNGKEHGQKPSQMSDPETEQ